MSVVMTLSVGGLFGGRSRCVVIHSAFHSAYPKRTLQLTPGHSRPIRHVNNVRHATIKNSPMHGSVRETSSKRRCSIRQPPLSVRKNNSMFHLTQ